MHMDVAGLAEDRVFEMMMLEIGDRMRHVGLARQERLFPERLAIAQDARRAANVGRQVADQDFRAEGGVAQLRMRQIEIIDALGDVVGKFVRQGKADAKRRAVIADDVDAGDLRLLAAVHGKGRRDQRRAGRHRHGAVALVEPFGLHARCAGRGLAAFQPHAEHLHGIGQRLFAVGVELLVHGVARRGGAEMRQARAGQVQMRRVGMVDR